MATLFAQGTKVALGDDILSMTPVYTEIVEILSISGPTMTRDQIDVTAQDSANQTRVFINGLLDPGELTFSINYDPDTATHGNTTGLLNVFDTGAKRAYRITFTDPGPTLWTFDAIVNGFEVQAPVDAQLTADITLRISGQINFA